MGIQNIKHIKNGLIFDCLGLFWGSGPPLEVSRGRRGTPGLLKTRFSKFSNMFIPKSYVFVRGKMRHKLAAQCPEFVQLSGAAGLTAQY